MIDEVKPLEWDRVEPLRLFDHKDGETCNGCRHDVVTCVKGVITLCAIGKLSQDDYDCWEARKTAKEVFSGGGISDIKIRSLQ